MPLLPIFPLGTVLFPGGTLPLHIFEERYKLMINECVDDDRPFGVVYIRSGSEVGGRAEPYAIGTTARIAKVERLPLGRLNVVTVGARRFRMISSDHSRPYLQAEVEFITRDPGMDQDADAAAERVASLFSEYYLTTLLLGEQWTRRVSMPTRAAILADFVAGRIDVDMQVKQRLLEAQVLCTCLEQEAEILGQANTVLRARLQALHRQKYGGFGAAN